MGQNNKQNCKSSYLFTIFWINCVWCLRQTLRTYLAHSVAMHLFILCSSSVADGSLVEAAPAVLLGGRSGSVYVSSSSHCFASSHSLLVLLLFCSALYLPLSYPNLCIFSCLLLYNLGGSNIRNSISYFCYMLLKSTSLIFLHASGGLFFPGVALKWR